MKKRFFSFVLIVFAIVAHIQAASITAEKLTIEASQTVELIVNMTNSETNLGGFEFRLYLPTGLSLAKNSRGKVIYTLGDRICDHTLSVTELSDGGYQFIAYSMDGYTIEETEGELLRVSVTASEDFVTSGNGSLTNVKVADVNTTTTFCDDATVYVNAETTTGGETTIEASNLTITAGGTAELSISMTNSATDLGGFEFRLYLPAGLTLAKNSRGKVIYTLGDRICDHTLSVTELSDGGYQFIAYSMDGYTIEGTEGELLSVTVTASDDFVTSGNGSLTNVKVADVNTATSFCDDATVVVNAGSAAGGETALQAADLAITAGGTAELSISMTNSATDLGGFEFRLYLPTGLTLAKNSRGKVIYTLGDRICDHTLSVTELSDGGYQFIAYSMDGYTIEGTEGELLSVTVTADNSFVGTANGTLSSVKVADVNTTTTLCDDVTFSITAESTNVIATSITLDKSSLSLTTAGQTATLTATVLPTDATDKSVTWTCSNTSVATVSSSGVVTAVANGTATITATTKDGSNLSKTCAVTVNILATSISLDKTSLSLTSAGQTATLSATVLPEGAADKSVTWTSSNTEVATVSSEGVVTAVANGTATITATTNDGSNLTASCEVTVEIADETDTDISQMENVIYIDKTEVFSGNSVSLPVCMKNILSPVGCSFKLILPEGFSLVEDQDGDVIYELSDRTKKMSVTMKNWNDRSYDFALIPTTGTAAISGNEGTIITFRIQVADGKALGDYKLHIQNNLIQSKASDTTQDFAVPDVKTTITVKDYTLGDVNGDDKVTPADAIMILYHYFNVTQEGFNEAAADINSDGNISPADAIEALYKYFGVANDNNVKSFLNAIEPD